MSFLTPQAPNVPRLLLKSREAADALGIGERTLWELTARGDPRHPNSGPGERTRYRDANQNLRTQLNRIIKRAGLKPWPKLFLPCPRRLRLDREHGGHCCQTLAASDGRPLHPGDQNGQRTRHRKNIAKNIAKYSAARSAHRTRTERRNLCKYRGLLRFSGHF